MVNQRYTYIIKKTYNKFLKKKLKIYKLNQIKKEKILIKLKKNTKYFKQN